MQTHCYLFMYCLYICALYIKKVRIFFFFLAPPRTRFFPLGARSPAPLRIPAGEERTEGKAEHSRRVRGQSWPRHCSPAMCPWTCPSAPRALLTCKPVAAKLTTTTTTIITMVFPQITVRIRPLKVGFVNCPIQMGGAGVNRQNLNWQSFALGLVV